MAWARSRRSLALAALACGGVLVAAVVALGPLDLVMRDRDRNMVVLGWDDDAGRLLVNEAIRAPLQQDGPYVRWTGDGRVEVLGTILHGGRYVPERRMLLAPASIDVVVDNPQRTRFRVPLRPPATPAPDAVAQPGRLLLVSDLDGDFDAFVALLRANGVIDAQLHWRFGTGQVAIAGDFMADGPNIVPLLWLLYRLQGEAGRAGGRVHVVLGNHELLLLAGRFSGAPQRLFASRDKFFDGDNRRMFAADTVLGQWLRAQPVVVKVGDTLVVHGGVSEVFLAADLDLAEANAIARRELDVDRRRVSDAAKPVIGRWGLPWYRGTAVAPDRGRTRGADPPAHLAAVLRRYGVRRVAIGHTRAPRVMLEQGGRVLRLDIDHLRAGQEGALFEDGHGWRVDARGHREPLQ